MTSANLLAVLFVGTVVGALVGLALGGVVSHPLLLAIIAGFLGTIIAGVVCNTVMKSFGAKTPSTIPMVVILYAAIASIAGSAAAVEIDHASGLASPVWIGTTAGLISGILMALLMITYHMTPRA